MKSFPFPLLAATLVLTPLAARAAPVALPGTFLSPPGLAADLHGWRTDCGDDDFGEEPAEEDDGDGNGDGDGGSEGPPIDACYSDDGPAESEAAAASLARGVEACSAYTSVWRIDCLSDELERAARELPNDGLYRQARQEILAAAAQLRAIARENADPALPPARRAAEVGDARRTSTRPLTPVARDRLPQANAQADAVLDNLSTTLLRSASTPTARVEYTRVAQAVDSTKVLLRSS